MLNVLMVRLVDQQRVIIGTLKAIGYCDSQIFAHYTKFAMILGLCQRAGRSGVGLLHVRLGDLRSTGSFYEFPDLENHVYLGTYGGGMAVALSCGLMGSLQAARAALRAQAGRSHAPQAAGARRRDLAGARSTASGGG